MNTTTNLFTGLLGVVLMVFGLLLFFAAVLLPFYVARIHLSLKLLQKDMHELLRYKRLEMGVSPKTAEEIRAECRK